MLTFQLHLYILLGIFNMLLDTPSPKDTLSIHKTNDFEIDGSGSAAEWNKTSWTSIPSRHGPDTAMNTRAKVLYSEKGIYFLFECEDQILSASLTEDFADLYEEDVVEVFLWTDEDYPIYFEYELSPLNYELPIIVPNFEGSFFGWRPWHYEGEKKTRHATSIQGGKKEPGASIQQWTAEFFIPYALLKPLQNVPPQEGTKWRANMYRIDYDGGEFRTWQWQPTSGSFHEYTKFGTFIFK